MSPAAPARWRRPRRGCDQAAYLEGAWGAVPRLADLMAAYGGPISAGPARSPSVSRMRAVNGRPGVAVPGDSDGCGRYPRVVSTESIGRLRARVGTVPRPRSVTRSWPPGRP